MSIPLQKTKLFFPSVRSGLVERPRLVAALNSLREEGLRLALVSATAGSGKTTLLVQWLKQLGWPAGWLALDARDNLPARFFTYLIAALQAAAPGAGSAAAALLELPGVSLEEVVTLLTNDLADAPGPFVLVLDDVHSVNNPAIHQALNMLLEAQPPQMRLVLLSREDPALFLSRWRARGQLVELRQGDLRFTLPEALVFLNQSMGLHLTTTQVELLEARTEGWIAGLQMAALSLQQADDPDAFIHDFSGSNRFILDYLIEEVLRSQPEEVQSFLLQTSLLERMCADLCAAVTGKLAGESQALLDRLAKANLFVIALDEERRWFRYHHLFGDLLRSRLHAERVDQIPRLCQNAAGWYEINGDPRLAVEYALKAHDPERAADLIEQHAGERWQTVDMEFFLLVNRLPQEVVHARPALCMQNAWTCALTGQLERVEPLVNAALNALDKPGRIPQVEDKANRAFAAVLRAFLADMANQPVELDDSLEICYASIPESSTGMRNTVAVIIGTMCFMEADFSGALRYLHDALERDKRVEGTNAVPIATSRATWVLYAQGKLRQAANLLRENIAYICQRGSRRFYISGVLQLELGKILLEWNALDEAEAEVREGLQLLNDWPSGQGQAAGLSLLARLHVARGNLAQARPLLDQAVELRRAGYFHPRYEALVEQALVQLWISEKDQVVLTRWVEENETPPIAALDFRYEAHRIEVCRALLASGHKEQAVALLTRLEQAARDRAGSLLAILALLAAAQIDNPPRAARTIEAALHLAAPEGYVRIFVDAGEGIRAALDAWLRFGESRENEALRQHALRILAALDRPGLAGSGATPDTAASPASPPSPRPEAALAEPLSPRELEVLSLVAQGLTNEQIAARLVISVRTVKKHIENIHGKLCVQNRTQAAARARELGLLAG